MTRALLPGMLAAAALVSLSCGPAGSEMDPLGPNAACYVCHMTFVREPLSAVHAKAKVGCIQCHGLSAPHANDEDVGATKPDITFKRDAIDPACRACHPAHDVPADKVVARWQERKSPPNPTCTQCHGSHKVARAK